MTRPETIPAPVLRAREIHRQLRVPKVSEVLDLRAVVRAEKSRRVFEKLRIGLERRLRK